MKRCPRCRRDYYDDTLLYCLDDGNALLEGPGSQDEHDTAVFHDDPASEAPTRVAGDGSYELPSGDASLARPFGRRGPIVLAAIAVAVISIGLFAGYRYLNRSEPGAFNSIAVLPFENRSGSADADYLSEGLADSLIYRLTQLPNLKVTPTSSVMRYKGSQLDIDQAARDLNVDAVMSGRLLQRGDDLSISVQLIDTRSRKLIWAEQYERRMSDLLATQREIAREIIENLSLKVSPQEKSLTKHYTESNEAYQLYLKGRFYWNKRTSESMRRSIEYYKQAIDADPGFALAYSGLADTYNLISAPEAGGGDEPPNEVLPLAKAAALKALEIDDSLAEAHVSLAHPLYYYDRDFAGAEREFNRAIALNPRYSVAHHWYAVFLTVAGRFDEALAEIKRAQELDPLSMSINVWAGWILALSGQNDPALEQLLKAKDMDPNFPLTRHRLALVYADLGKHDLAVSEARDLQKISGGKLGSLTLAYVYARAGMRREALEELNTMIAASTGRFESPAAIGMIYGILGDKDAAFKWLETANEEHDLLVLRIKNDRRFADLRGDPRYDALVKQMRLPE